MAALPGPPHKQAGILPVPTQVMTAAPKPSKRAAQEGLKIQVRRLPPGLTEEEFVEILGDEWKAGNGKVGWFSFKQGKVAKEISKTSRPGVAYLQVSEGDVAALSETVQSVVWEDAKGTNTDPALIGPPIVVNSIYQKLPSTKVRTDVKEGTIDQDRDYQEFLASLTNPTPPKEADTSAADEDLATADSETKTTTTPLIEYLREKKANKAKESSKSAKHARQDSQGGKGKSSGAGLDDTKKKSKTKGTERIKETVKILRKQASVEAAEAAKTVEKEIRSNADSSEAPKSHRAGIAAAARILKRDLGLSAGSAHRRARQEAAKQDAAVKAETDAKAKDSSNKYTASQAATLTSTPLAQSSNNTTSKTQSEKPARGSRGRRGKDTESGKAKAERLTEGPAAASIKAPVILQKKKDGSGSTPAPVETAQSATSAAPPAPPSGPKASTGKGSQVDNSQKKGSTPAPPTPGETRAFVKHANPSQGVTEPLLKEAMSAFGSVTFVEIDRRKGFAYVDFAEHNGLVKAIAASPVSVARATVWVLERKETASSKNKSSSAGKEAPAPAPAAGPSSSDGARASNGASKEASAASAASSESKANEHKRSRRRGGRGRDGGTKAKENKDGKDGSGKNGRGNAASNASTGQGTASAPTG